MASASLCTEELATFMVDAACCEEEDEEVSADLELDSK